MIRITTLFLVASFFFSSCTDKENLTINEYQLDTLSNNVAPPYSEISTLEINNFVNKVYIDLLGREPLAEELSTAATSLKTDNVSDTVLDDLLDGLFADDAYYERFNELYTGQLLNGAGSAYILEQKGFYEIVKLEAEAEGNTLFVQLIEYEIGRLDLLIDAYPMYASGSITINEYFKRLVNNAVYDEINMGSANFVIACFEGLLKREPTETNLEGDPTTPNDDINPDDPDAILAELESGIKMVNGSPAKLLQTDGVGKDDFIDILVNADEFYQGLVIDIYLQMLVRQPDGQEMETSTSNLALNKDYQAIQRLLIKSSEYKGF